MLKCCPLCEIPKREMLLYEDDLVYLVPTLDLKGHKVRVMAVIKRHSSNPTFEEQVTADAVLINYMLKLMGGKDWYIVSSQNASIPNHYHRMACDFPLEDEADPLFPLTNKVAFPLKGR